MLGKRTFMQHWPVVVLAVGVVTIFVLSSITFEVEETEYAVVMRFGKPRTENGRTQVFDAGLHLRWPYPIETVWRHDNRLQCYDLEAGETEQILTDDDYQVIVTTYVLWKVDRTDPGLFLKRINTTSEAEKKLDEVVRNSRNIVMGRHSLTELINTSTGQVRIREIEDEILQHLRPVASTKYGIDVQHLGFKHLGFPETVSSKVFERMRAERKRKSEKYRAEGKRDSAKIKAAADLRVSEILTEAQAQGKRIRAEGDQTAATHYSAFRSNPELAVFLRKLDSLQKTLSDKTTLILDTNTPPYDLLLPEATDLLQSGKDGIPGGSDSGESE